MRLTPILLCLAIAGCIGGPNIAPSAATTPTATPTVTTGDGAFIEQRLEQLTQSIQETTSTITHNNALDAERRKLEESRDRKGERREASNGLLIAGIILFAFLIKPPVGPYWRGIIMMVSISLIGGAFLMPYLWPF